MHRVCYTILIIGEYFSFNCTLERQGSRVEGSREKSRTVGAEGKRGA